MKYFKVCSKPWVNLVAVLVICIVLIKFYDGTIFSNNEIKAVEFQDVQIIPVVKVSPSNYLANDSPKIIPVVKRLRDGQESNADTQYSNNKNEARHVVLLKVAKTGSSTMTNIFLRFAYSRSLTVMLPHSDDSIRESCCKHVISFKNSLTEKNIVAPPPGRHYDILCSHVIYNREQMRRYFPEDTVYVGIVREPIQRLESAIRFYRIYEDVNLDDVAADPFKYNKLKNMTTKDNHWEYPVAKMSNNRMAYEFGFPKELFPTSIKDYNDQNANEGAVKNYINLIDNEFKIILITERMDESVVLMKRLLQWTLKDILHYDINVAKQQYSGFTENAQAKIKQYLYLDFAIYKFSVHRFEHQIKSEGPDFPNEVEHYQCVQKRVLTFCRKPRGTLQIDRSKWNEPFSMGKSDCSRMSFSEKRFIKKTRIRLYKTDKN